MARTRTPERGRIAWIITAVSAVVVATAMGFCLVLVASGRGLEALPFVGIGAVAAVMGVIAGHITIRRQTGQAGERIIFETFFPAMMSIVPIAGPFIALWGAIKLLRGKLRPATISTTRNSGRSTNTYPAADIGSAGVPMGMILLLLAGVQPLVAVSLIGQTTDGMSVHGADPSGLTNAEESTAPDSVANGIPVETAENFRRYAVAGCAGLVDCYSQAQYMGQVAGRAVMQVSDAGQITDVKVKLSGDDAKIERCLRALCGSKQLPDFRGPAGELTCEWAGSVSGKAQAVVMSPEFVAKAEKD